jgi:hypothetical protein
MAKSTNALLTGRIQKRKTNTLHRSHPAYIAEQDGNVRFVPQSGHPPSITSSVSAPGQCAL